MVLPKKLVVKMIPQMNAAEIITTEFDKNIFYGPVKEFPKDLLQIRSRNIPNFFRKLLKIKLFLCILVWVNS
jgi:hypothetical protein